MLLLLCDRWRAPLREVAPRVHLFGIGGTVQTKPLGASRHSIGIVVVVVVQARGGTVGTVSDPNVNVLRD